MRDGIHPKYGVATIQCGCGNKFETQLDEGIMRIDVCSRCHPYFTGEQRSSTRQGRSSGSDAGPSAPTKK